MMKNIEKILKGLVLSSFLVGVLIASPARAENNGSGDEFLNARTSLKADALLRLENSVGVVLGSGGSVRVLGAEVSGVSGSDINATASFGDSSLRFVVKTDSDTKINGRSVTSKDAVLSSLKAGDKISFSGTITSSSSSSITVDAEHVVSRTLATLPENKTSWHGEVKSVNTSDNSLSIELKDGRTVKVTLSASAVVSINGETKTLSALKEGDEVKIMGTANTDGSVITATKVSVDSDEGDKDKKDREEKSGQRKGFWNKIMKWFRK